jgi:hypothetical protein
VRQALSTGTGREEGADSVQRFARLVAVAAIALAANACQSAPQGGEKWRPIFDGKTLDGWTAKIRGFPLGENYRDTFSVKDGAIVVSYAVQGLSPALRIQVRNGAPRRHAHLGHRKLRRDDLRAGPEDNGRR